MLVLLERDEMTENALPQNREYSHATHCLAYHQRRSIYVMQVTKEWHYRIFFPVAFMNICIYWIKTFIVRENICAFSIIEKERAWTTFVSLLPHTHTKKKSLSGMLLRMYHVKDTGHDGERRKCAKVPQWEKSLEAWNMKQAAAKVCRKEVQPVPRGNETEKNIMKERERERHWRLCSLVMHVRSTHACFTFRDYMKHVYKAAATWAVTFHMQNTLKRMLSVLPESHAIIKRKTVI